MKLVKNEILDNIRDHVYVQVSIRVCIKAKGHVRNKVLALVSNQVWRPVTIRVKGQVMDQINENS